MDQVDAVHTRNLCIVAHVDHGKSSFADSLLASNGIISTRLAGTIRYLDSREDEQERGITMESSAVSLKWRIPAPLTAEEGEAKPPRLEEYRINLIDTPGHVDFSSEVSTASRLCDGALVLVDAVEGVCTQTITVLRQTHLSRLRPLLVINKIDRLVTELKLSPEEAYHHLARIIEDVNAVVGSFFAGERMEDDYHRQSQPRSQSKQGNVAQEGEDVDDDDDGPDDSHLYFDPAEGTVIFASAIDAWAFRTTRFAQLYAKKLGMNEDTLNKCLWGDWYIDPKTKRVINRKKMEASGKRLKPLFVQFVLENIWAVYDSVVVNYNRAKIEKITSALQIKVKPQDLKASSSSAGNRPLLLSIFSQWLPLAPSTFRAVIDKVPPPPQAQAQRLPYILHPETHFRSNILIQPKNNLERALYSGNEDQSSISVAYVSKMFAVSTQDLPENQRKALTADEMRARAKAARERKAREAQSGANEQVALPTPPPAESHTPSVSNQDEPEQEEAETSDSNPENREVLLGFARLYSGTLERGESLYAVLPKYNSQLPPSHPSNIRHISVVTIDSLYVMMGRELVQCSQVRAGNLFAVGGLAGTVARNATLCAMSSKAVLSSNPDEDRDCLVNLASVSSQSTAAPIVRVALEPEDPSEMSKLVEGLRILNQSDPCVETLVQETGEHVILTAGELHLERCLKDLRDRFAKIEITVSPPIVPFRETAVKAPDMAPPKTAGQPRGTIQASLQSGLVTFTVRAVPLPDDIVNFILANVSTLRRLQGEKVPTDVIDNSEESAAREGTEASNGNDDDEETRKRNDLVTKQVSPEEFWPVFEKLCRRVGKGGEWSNLPDQLWAFGPRRVGPNVLVDRTPNSPRALRKRLAQSNHPSTTGTPLRAQSPAPSSPATKSTPLSSEELAKHIVEDNTEPEEEEHQFVPDVNDLNESLDNAFQLATFRGPLCAEPVTGMAFFLESISVNDFSDQDLSPFQLRTKWSNARGAMNSTARESFHNAMVDWSPRLKLATYSCDIQATAEVLGKVYGVVARRRGKIVSEEMKEGTSFFTVRALIPVVESFGFADDIRTRTSGAASPQLVFHGYEMLDQDPFWVPTTEEELEDLGEKSDRENIAKRYMDQVRRRKGMAVERKVVEHAEKQKTMRNA